MERSLIETLFQSSLSLQREGMRESFIVNEVIKKRSGNLKRILV